MCIQTAWKLWKERDDFYVHFDWTRSSFERLNFVYRGWRAIDVLSDLLPIEIDTSKCYSRIDEIAIENITPILIGIIFRVIFSMNFGEFSMLTRFGNTWRTTGDDSAQLAHVNPRGETCNKIRWSIDSSHGTVIAIGYLESKSNYIQKLTLRCKSVVRSIKLKFHADYSTKEKDRPKISEKRKYNGVNEQKTSRVRSTRNWAPTPYLLSNLLAVICDRKKLSNW